MTVGISNMSNFRDNITKLNNEDSRSNIAGCSTKLTKLFVVNNNGYTLIEAVIAAMLILIISVPFINFIASTLKARAIAQERLVAMSIAVETIEEISSVQGKAWNDIDELVSWVTGTNKSFINTGDSNTYYKNDGKYTIFILIDEEQPKKEDGAVVEGIFEVIVTVKYDTDREVSLLTVFREV